MLEGHYFVQTPHEGNTQGGVAKATEHKGQTQHFDVDVVCREEVETRGVERHGKKSYGDELIDIEAPYFQPEPRHETARPDAGQCPQRERA